MFVLGFFLLSSFVIYYYIYIKSAVLDESCCSGCICLLDFFVVSVRKYSVELAVYTKLKCVFV